MEHMNKFYRAYKAYKEAFEGDKQIAEFRDVLSQSTTNVDSLRAVRTYAIVEEDWVKTIEEEMFFVEKAIREERQFIRQEGEVIPIEKVKKVSNHSVKHLAKHSELISKEAEGLEEVIPDGLFVVEKLTDFAVYENRFLYMLLNYVKDFITIRLDKVLELGMTYKSDVEVKKDVHFNHRHFVYEAKIHDVNRRDKLSSGHGNANDMVKRMEDQLGMTMVLLNTPLMQEVSKVPMLKPPITKTNVLRMNNNFRHALELYHYLASYDKPGYEIKEIKNFISPFTEPLMDEFSHAMVLVEMLSYQYGNKLSETLHTNFLKEEEERKKARDEQAKKRIKELKDKYKKTGKGLEDYLLELEDRNKELEGYRSQNIILNEKNHLLSVKVDNLSAELKENLQKVETLTQEVAEWCAKYEQDMSAQKTYYENYIIEQKNSYETTIQTQKEYYENTIAYQKAEFDSIIEQNNEKFQLAMEEKQAWFDSEFANQELNWQNKLAEVESQWNGKVEDKNQEIADLHKAFEKEKDAVLDSNKACGEQVKQILWRYQLAVAELNALRHKYGLIPATEDFTDKNRFKELEKQFQAFIALFKAEWDKTKKRIKKEIMSVYPQKEIKNIYDVAELAGKSLVEDRTFKEPAIKEQAEEQTATEPFAIEEELTYEFTKQQAEKEQAEKEQAEKEQTSQEAPAEEAAEQETSDAQAGEEEQENQSKQPENEINTQECAPTTTEQDSQVQSDEASPQPLASTDETNEVISDTATENVSSAQEEKELEIEKQEENSTPSPLSEEQNSSPETLVEEVAPQEEPQIEQSVEKDKEDAEVKPKRRKKTQN